MAARAIASSLGVARRSAGAALRPHARAFSSKVREKGKGEEADFFRKQEREQLAKMNSAKSKPVERVGVIGLGLMGHGIAQVAAERGFEVVAVDLEQRFLDGGMKRVEGSVRKLAARAVKKGKMSEQEASAQAEASLGRITPTTDLGALAECDAVIEAVIEDLALKEKLYATIGATVSNTCIIASNTSSLPITKMGAFSGRSAQMVGMHFFNPAQLMKLVEVIRTEHTDPAIFSRAMSLATAMGKTPVECIDTPGFVVNRLLVPYIIEAILLAERGVASFKDIDVAMRLGASHPMGPIQLADYVGLDTCLSIISGWQAEYPTEGFKVPESLCAKVAEGKLGRKSGEGFYRWDGDKLAE